MTHRSAIAAIDDNRQVQMTNRGRGVVEAQNRVYAKQPEMHERAVTHQQSLELVKILLLVSVRRRLSCLPLMHQSLTFVSQFSSICWLR